MFYSATYTKNNFSFFVYAIFATVIFFFLVGMSPSQKIIINGKVIDEKGKPINAATVTLEKTKIAISTNKEGEFELISEYENPKLVVTAIGFESAKKSITKDDIKDSVATITITLKEEVTVAEEVILTGYTTKRKEMKRSVTSVSSKLEGRLSGVSVTSATSETKIRGAASISDKTISEDKSFSKEDDVKTENNSEKQTRLLTAGEVNDFKKWKMWEDYNESDFKMHSEKWQLFATGRYSVQLQNKELKAVVGQKIYLISESGDTLWRAVSDNTGKAELWNGFSASIKKTNLFIAVDKEKQTFAAIPFPQGINHIVIDHPCTVSNKVEIAFLVDATGSMQDEISYLKEELEDILSKVSSKDKSLDLHTGAVFYRDKGDDYVTKKQAFTQGIATTVDFISHQFAAGGGDYPEALKDGLQEAVEALQWSFDARTRIIFLLMDAPPHDNAKLEMVKLISEAAAKGIRIVPVACSGTDKETEFIMRSIALATDGTYLFLTDDSGIGDSHIKPTTDEFTVELLNDLLQRIIEQMCYVNSCETKTGLPEPVSTFPNPEKIKVFPNPTKGNVSLETNKELKEIAVADFTGKILLHRDAQTAKGSYSFDLSQFPAGTYFIKYVTNENRSGAEKVLLIR
ncbi:carboxypeptidase-like regulatory domain-containing protein [Ferruginibacter albus]|uniref:carboxypeptidase-like regulatory domain-containing protein n=1 Tax=Ferruginibacter albus TaxID=2875540 RepID=UPI001CC400C8|nr:carboxypeptidase-like regulatory domain-containing protein [Ferruginibacter albus]UAY52820.1 carboxypeptidase-like regulatory domain-containing protein [Ferruginibacter albus]